MVTEYTQPFVTDMYMYRILVRVWLMMLLIRARLI